MNVSGKNGSSEARRPSLCGNRNPATKDLLSHIRKDYNSGKLRDTSLVTVFRLVIAEKVAHTKHNKDVSKQQELFIAEITKLPNCQFKTESLAAMAELQRESGSVGSGGDAVPYTAPGGLWAVAGGRDVISMQSPRPLIQMMSASESVSTDETAGGTLIREDALDAMRSPRPPMQMMADEDVPAVSTAETAMAPLRRGASFDHAIATTFEQFRIPKTDRDMRHNEALIRTFVETCRTLMAPLQTAIPKYMAFVDSEILKDPSKALALMEMKIEFARFIVNTVPADQLPSPAQFGLLHGYVTRDRSPADGKMRPTYPFQGGQLRANNTDFLGSGSYGVVKTGDHQGPSTTQELALKRIRLVKSNGEIDYKLFIDTARELMVGQQLSQAPNLVPIIDARVYDDGKKRAVDGRRPIGSDPKVVLIMPVAGNDGNVFFRETPLFADKLRYMTDTGEGLVQMHRHDIAHCDFKLGNTVRDANNGKVLDFGMAVSTTITALGAVPYALRLVGGTYYPPEALDVRAGITEQCTDWKKIDVFAFGVELFHTAQARNGEIGNSIRYSPDHENHNTRGIDQNCVFKFIDDSKIATQAWRRDPEMKDLADIIDRCLSENPAERPTMDEVVATLRLCIPTARPVVAAVQTELQADDSPAKTVSDTPSLVADSAKTSKNSGVVTLGQPVDYLSDDDLSDDDASDDE
jgi:serine/threonine protein kinase